MLKMLKRGFEAAVHLLTDGMKDTVYPIRIYLL
jgi:hypothetical protein